MWLSVDHRDHDRHAARNLTRGAAEDLPLVLTRLSHSIPRPYQIVSTGCPSAIRPA
jgi:hypothetical protein